MKQMGEKVKQSGTGDKGHALSFCIIHPEEPVHVYGTALERPFHVCSLDIAGGRTPMGKKEKLTPGVEIEENPVFGFWDCFMELVVNLPVSGIKSIVPGHLEVFFQLLPFT